MSMVTVLLMQGYREKQFVSRSWDKLPGLQPVEHILLVFSLFPPPIMKHDLLRLNAVHLVVNQRVYLADVIANFLIMFTSSAQRLFKNRPLLNDALTTTLATCLDWRTVLIKVVQTGLPRRWYRKYRIISSFLQSVRGGWDGIPLSALKDAPAWIEHFTPSVVSSDMRSFCQYT